MPGMCASLSGIYPSRARIARGSLATSMPNTRICPLVGFTNPSSALSIVLLPAPLGPSSPTAPFAKLALTFLSA